MAKSEGEPKRPNPRQFRLSPETLADLDLIADTLSRETGLTFTRTDAVRYSARQVADRIRKKQKGEDKA